LQCCGATGGGLQDFRADSKWPKYFPWCDEFFIAVGRDFPRIEIPEGVGLLVDRYGAEIVRPAPTQTITAHWCRKLTRRFARISAGRLKFLGKSVVVNKSPHSNMENFLTMSDSLQFA